MAGEIVCGQGGSAAGATARSWSIRFQSEIKDITNFASNGWRERKACVKSWEGEFEAIAYPTQTTGSIAVGTFVTTNETGSKTYSGSIAVGEITPNVPYDDIVTFRVSFQGHGSLTIA